MEKNFNLKEALKAGATKDGLMDSFAKQLAEATKELEQEKRDKNRKEELDDAREDMVDSMLIYLHMMGLVDDEDLDDENLLNALTEGVKEVEPEIKAMIPLMKSLRSIKSKAKEGDSADDIIKMFLKSL